MVRHGQAMFLTDDYDRLSDLGATQAARVGVALAGEGVGDAIFRVGTLKRQRETLAALGKAGNYAAVADTESDSAFDEFPFDAMLHRQIDRLRGQNARFDAAIAAYDAAVDRPDRIRSIQQLLELAIDDWVGQELSDADAGLPSWRTFCGTVMSGVARLQAEVPSGSDVVLVTSGGVVAAVTQHALGATFDVAARLCWRVNNASITQLTFNRERLSLDHFNRVGHLPANERTYR